MLERLLVGQRRVLEQDREDDQRDTEADTDDAEDPLDVLVSGVDSGSRSGADGVGDDPGVGGSVDLGGEGDVANGLFEFLGQELGPDCARDATAEG